MFYDKFVVVVGLVMNVYGVKGLEYCYFLKDIRDVWEICNRIICNLELVCLLIMSDEDCKRLLLFVVSGGGLIGVEFVVELYDLLNEDLI